MALDRRAFLRLLAATPALGWARSAEAARRGPLVGLVTSTTGSIATYGISASRGAAMAFQGVSWPAGRPVQLVTVDDRSDPENAAPAVAELLAHPDLVAVLGPVMSSAAHACVPLVQSAGVPMLCTTSTNPVLTQRGDRVLRSCLTDPQQGRVLATYLLGRGLSRAALLVDPTNDYSTGIAHIFVRTFQQGGGEVVAGVGYAEVDFDFAAPLREALAATPDVLVIPGYYASVGLAARQARELGYTGLFAGSDGWDSERLYEIGRDAIVGGVYVNHWAADDPDPTARAFTERFRAAYGTAPDAVAALTYDAAGVLIAALSRVAPARLRARRPADLAALREAVHAELAATRDYPSLTGPLTIGPDREASRGAVVVEVTAAGPRFVARVG